jgi:hypothetical protein
MFLFDLQWVLKKYFQSRSLISEVQKSIREQSGSLKEQTSPLFLTQFRLFATDIQPICNLFVVPLRHNL